MFVLETAIDTWINQYRYRPSYSECDIREIESHVREHIRVLMESGEAEESAFRQATAEFGDIHSSDDEYGKVFWGKKGGRGPWWHRIQAGRDLLAHYFRSSLRSLAAHPGFSTVNVFGLAVGLCAAFLMLLFVRQETSYDTFHPQAEQIHRILLRSPQDTYSSRSQFVLPPSALESIPGIESYARLSWERTNILTVEGESWQQRRFFSVDSTFFEVFGYELIAGDPQTALDAPDALVMAESTARRLFGHIDILGERILVNQSQEYFVSGIAADPPPGSHLQFEVLDAISNFENSYGDGLNDWSTTESHNYLKLTAGASPETVTREMQALAASRMGESEFDQMGGYELQPITRTHLYSSDVVRDIQEQGDIRYIQLLQAIALLILAISMANYINLATARSLGRARETGMRKVVGASRQQLLTHYLGEAVLVALAAAFVAFILALVVQPYMAQVTDSHIDRSFLVSGWPLLLAVGLLTGLLAGLYPAVLQSRIAPSAAMKAEGFGSTRSGLRNVMVVFQFVVTTALIMGAVILVKQLRFIQTMDLGFDKENVLVIRVPGSQIGSYEALRQALTNEPGIQAVTASSNIPPEAWGTPAFTPAGSDSSISTKLYSVDFNYLDVMGMDLVSGRSFDSGRSLDSTSAFIINEAAVRALGYTPESAIGKEASLGWVNRTGQIIGVVEDFHFRSARNTVAPVALTVAPGFFWKVLIRFRASEATRVLEFTEQTWNSLAPGWPFDRVFLDEAIAADYGDDRRMGHLLGFLSLMAVCLASIGLFGLVSFSTRKRGAEIGIRKVLGASVAGLLALLCRDYARLVAIGFMLGMPLAWWLGKSWLNEFAYATTIGMDVFLQAALLVLAVAAVSIFSQTLRAATANPVTAIRSE